MILLLNTLSYANPLPITTSSQGETNLPAPEQGDATPIINGEMAQDNDYPMTGGMLMHAVIFGQEVDTFVCSSTLIAPDVVLLAAHCLDDTAFTFGFGEVEDKELWWTRQADLTSWDGSAQSPPLPEDAVGVVDWVIHPDFSMETFDIGITQNDDIALLFLDTAITEIDHAFLPTDGLGSDIAEGMSVDIVGWGQQIPTGQFEAPPADSYAIKYIGTSTIDELGSHEFQVGAEETAPRKCHGDSGGPSFIMMDSALRVVGVTSHAYDTSDCFETGGVDTRVDPYIPWIDAEMKSKCEDGTRLWCDVQGIVRPSDYFVEEPEAEKRRILGCSSSTAEPLFFTLLLSMFITTRRRLS